jgi:hypothetical protein
MIQSQFTQKNHQLSKKPEKTMALSAQRAMLDALMGATRNLAPDEAAAVQKCVFRGILDGCISPLESDVLSHAWNSLVHSLGSTGASSGVTLTFARIT